ncbi:MAG TPA: hypothetical protein VEC11_06295 [Allosphingosinicella sp.]|nr:hypothetical protein [Allosphingosinicella sp.]
MSKRAGTMPAALLAAGLLIAAKPLPPGDAGGGEAAQPTREEWRSRAVPVCVARLRENRAFTPDDLEAICGCTFDTYLEGHGANPLPGLENDRIPVAVEHQLLGCTARTRPDQTSAVRRLNAIWPQGAPPMPAPAEADNPKPLDEADVPVDGPSEGSESGGGFWEWVRNFSLPAWLTGASILWWVALGIFLFGLLILKLRRRDPRKDLVAPPSYMRRGAPPQPPRRPDLPR